MNQNTNNYLAEERIGKLLLKFSIPCIMSLLVAARKCPFNSSCFTLTGSFTHPFKSFIYLGLDTYIQVGSILLRFCHILTSLSYHYRPQHYTTITYDSQPAD